MIFDGVAIIPAAIDENIGEDDDRPVPDEELEEILQLFKRFEEQGDFDELPKDED